MVFSLPIKNAYQTDIKKVGKTIQELNTIATNSDFVTIESSVVLDTDCFESYVNTRILSDQIVRSCIEYCEKCGFTEVDMYLSVYKDCLINVTPISVSVSFSKIYNAIVSLYERWFDAKPASKRIVLRIDPSETYPSILIQPHREVELTTVTRHPGTGKLFRDEDGKYLVHCSKPKLTKAEERMIKAVDAIIGPPRKIVYVQNTDGIYVIRRTIEYPMTAEARIYQVLDKYENGSISNLKAITLIKPDWIAKIIGHSYDLNAKNQYEGMAAGEIKIAVGKAVFRWSNASSIIGNSIFLADELEPDDIVLLGKCVGAVFSRGGMTSHGATACRGLGIACITCSSDLIINRENQKSFIAMGEEIHEGDRICIADSKWSVGGEIIIDDIYKSACSDKMMGKFRKLILPYYNSQETKKLPIELQFHISDLLRTLKKMDIINENITA